MGLKGYNSMELSQVTMVEIVQYYFDNVLFAEGKAPKVDTVEGTAGYGEGFKIGTKDQQVVDGGYHERSNV